MFTSMIRTRIIAVSAAMGLLFSSFVPIFRKECFLPSPAAENSSAVVRDFGAVEVVDAEEVEYSLWLFEWFKEIFR